MSKNMPSDSMNNPFAQQQKILLYVFPLVFAVSGVNFPIGVLLYWLTTNVWSMGQQFYVIRRNPAPGSPAAEALAQRKAARAARHHTAVPSGAADTSAGDGNGDGDGDGAPVDDDGSGPRPGGQRQQPKRPKKKKS
jgi:YidC/Oxa1 family membrane protein insertase